MASVRAYLRSQAIQEGSPSKIITDVNRLFSKDVMDTGVFMTLFFIVIEASSGHATWVRAGHEPAFLYNPVSDNFVKLEGKGLPLGVKENYRYISCSVTIKPGQILILTTDGLWENRNRKGEMFGRKRFLDVIRKSANLGAEDIQTAIFDAVSSFQGKTQQDDDITLLILKFIRSF
jgi:sigma-B regulation protein RsbU (phosphoserine phosphatase)